MITFGCSVTEEAPYRLHAEPGIRLAAEPDSPVLAFAAAGTLGRSLNLLLDHAGRQEDLEALVIVHPYAEITDPDFCAKLRGAFADPDVALAGCVGAAGVEGLGWWRGRVNRGCVMHRYGERGGGRMPAYAWSSGAPASEPVEVVDEFLLALSPWAVRSLRFDEATLLSAACHLDLCLQAREAGRRVALLGTELTQHRPLKLLAEPELWVESHIALGRKWQGRLPVGPGSVAPADVDWRARARQAEAEREAARALSQATLLLADARVRALEEELDRLTGTASWRLTKPLREVNRLRREWRDRQDARDRGG